MPQMSSHVDYLAAIASLNLRILGQHHGLFLQVLEVHGSSWSVAVLVVQLAMQVVAELVVWLRQPVTRSLEVSVCR
jgi:hypothetical protein